MGREITKDDIDLLVTKNLETTVFVVGSALMAGNYDKAYQQLDLLFYQKEEPVAVLAVLSSNLSLIHILKTELRQKYKRIRKNLDPEKQRAMDAEIQTRLLALRQYGENDVIFTYLSNPCLLYTSRCV